MRCVSSNLTGHDLEVCGKAVFEQMGLVCINPLNQVLLREVDPSGPYSDDHLEFDYLVPYGKACLVGEIKGGINIGDIRRAYTRFKRHFDLVRQWNLDERILKLLGVPEDHLRDFRQVRELKGFFITSRLEKFDIDILSVANIVCFFRSEWRLLVEYSQTIGPYAKDHFTHRFDIRTVPYSKELVLQPESNGLTRISDKKIASGDVGLADLYTFEASPYDLLPMARVYRRDELPSLSSTPEKDYQRPLIRKKLDEIRTGILDSQDSMFPNSILVVLSNECEYSDTKQKLTIPQKYGAISVIDGQHRLFSYADKNVQNRLGENAKILITAIKFQENNQEIIHTYSAKAFVEINTNQTRIHPTHLDAIAYEILGQTHSRAIAAQVILRANRRKGRLYGLFDTNQTGLGIIQSSTVLSALKTITNLDTVQRLRSAQRGNPLDKRLGYENLLQASIDDLCQAEQLINGAVTCLAQYFNRVADVFPLDWPERGNPKGSSMEYAKVVTGFVRLLWQFISEGGDWQAVQTELENIRKNIMRLRRIRNNDVIIFDRTHPDIPNSNPNASEDYHFLNSNRKTPTSIQDILAQRRTR